MLFCALIIAANVCEVSQIRGRVNKRRRTATLRFSVVDDTATTLCRLDRGDFERCKPHLDVVLITVISHTHTHTHTHTYTHTHTHTYTHTHTHARTHTYTCTEKSHAKPSYCHLANQHWNSCATLRHLSLVLENPPGVGLETHGHRKTVQVSWSGTQQSQHDKQDKNS